MSQAGNREASPPRQGTKIGGLVGQLCDIWAELLGHDQVEPDDNFFDLGGDSIRAARLFATLERELGLGRPPSLLLEFPTPAALAEALEHGDTLENEAGTWHSLVPVQPGGQRPPLFLVHDGAGEVVYGHRLAHRLGPDQPIYAIRGAALQGTNPLQQTLEELAAHYVSLVRQVAPIGPYSFYGASAGGKIALAMALQLQGAGEDVPLLAVGDTGWKRADPAEGTRGWRRLFTFIRTGHFKHAALLPVAHLYWYRNSRKRSDTWEERRKAFSMQYYGGLVHAAHWPERFEGSVLVFHATKRQGHPDDPRPDLGWSAYCAHPPAVQRVRCVHPDLGTEAGVDFIAGPLASALDRIRPHVTATASAVPAGRIDS